MTKKEWEVAALKFRFLYPDKAEMIIEAEDLTGHRRSTLKRYARRHPSKLFMCMDEIGVPRRSPLVFLRGLKEAWARMDQEAATLRAFLNKP